MLFINYFNSCLLTLCFCLIKFQSKLQLKERKGSYSMRNWRKLPEQSLFWLPEKGFWIRRNNSPLSSTGIWQCFYCQFFFSLLDLKPPLNAVKYRVKPKPFTERVMRTSSLDKLLPNYATLLLSLPWIGKIYGWNRDELKLSAQPVNLKRVIFNKRVGISAWGKYS